MNSKSQSLISIGIGLIVIGAILLVFAYSQPKESITNLTSTTSDTTLELESSSTEATSSTQSMTNLSEKVVSSSISSNDDVSTISVTYPLNLNTCTQQELQSINGIGETRANAIIQYREHLGGYTSVEQLKDIKGFGDALYEKILPYVTL